jgi:hypothetical protein
MSLSLNLGSIGNIAISSDGDLAKLLHAGVNSLVNFQPQLLDVINSPVSRVPSGSVTTEFNFSFAPSWTIAQKVAIHLSVKPEASCKLSIIAPGDTLFSYNTGEENTPNPVKAPDNVFYIGIDLECSIALDAGAAFSSGNFGINGSLSTNEQFRISNYYAVAPTVLLRDAISQAFSHFVLPFHADSVTSLPVGDYLDFEFIGKLNLGFGATYGFSSMFLAALSPSEVQASVATPVGKAIISAAPSFQVGAGFKFNYTYDDLVRVIVGRTAAGATLYLLRQHDSSRTGTENIGITLNAGASFQLDGSTLKTDVQTAAQTMLGPKAGPLLGDKLAGVVGGAVDDVNNSVNKLLKKADGKSLELELIQSATSSDTALFIYNFDFSLGTGAYEVAMSGDYARALTMPGVTLDPRSFIEQVYTKRAGLNLEFFGVFTFSDMTSYIQKKEIAYVGNQTFQIRNTSGVEATSGILGRQREADLYFIAQCKDFDQRISDASVQLRVVFVDTNNASAFVESERMMQALGLSSVAAAASAFVSRNPRKSLKFTFDIDTAALAAIDDDEYSNNKPPAEPHLKDQRNYEAFASALGTVVGPADSILTTFARYFSKYPDWLEFNRIKTDQEGSRRPGDRLNEGNLSTDLWPENKPPSDNSSRDLVQVDILAGQQFMNLCAGIKHLQTVLPGTTTESEFENLGLVLKNMVTQDTPFPTYFLKPSIVALLNLASVSLVLDGDLPDAATSASFVVSLKQATLARALVRAA